MTETLAIVRPARRTAAVLTAGWAIVFAAFHAYWALGGRFGFGEGATVRAMDRSFATPAFTAYNLVVVALGLVGALVAGATVNRWGRAIPRRLLIAAMAVATVLLVVRGGIGLLDELLRGTGIAPLGLTGETAEEMYQRVLDDPHPSAYTLWSARGIDLYFTLGGVLYGWLLLGFARRAVSR